MNGATVVEDCPVNRILVGKDTGKVEGVDTAKGTVRGREKKGGEGGRDREGSRRKELERGPLNNYSLST